ncbi:carbamoyl-phosphate synthase, small chain [Corynebacterium glutamicum MB001]|uniref:Carbamoyl phosphate synthase small chain n=1 Tax=Corynebacterium glutamicum (strain ATCC 13032 / DSM 20300 / JCM 1318 / BCRC 11384 / CCUG 27702 / LMG 3730 / NBRC 12168 / NCIMB 10025 / NRRL B-2784 / 534) TaxID=196627 RepID=CARA_CORGL|nr:glutamine-hydrolyzing carbamoyl-phosphate synthase small subunit [Corynebacterium glutamicum]P58893.1 RecName: Full=Carbamoyl phosphate synthase small chain; AltName: Full=Carbamoyl phosphate synthetase glutamine chain [Corynebacterium glutamicum ATCC 13032]AGT05567.1 carbamoyl-phosphate synthase, small chain [Corynebacterium glutamicum MB001]ARV64262.1 carbamoyl-phosphate synthase small subunit [Corynebacterium glutamicum]ASW14217.1 carbamoyl-phosphate synthase, small chain [Corynebacterium
MSKDTTTYQGVTEIGSVPAYLVLADGRTFTGFGFGAIGTTLGEAVFTTAMTGYQETMTDPSYHRQIVVATAPQIGNTGWNDEDNESRDGKIWVAGLVIRDLAARVSNWRATTSLQQEMAGQGIVGIGGIDTRALVRHLRNEGSIAAGIFSGADAQRPVEELVEIVKNQPAMTGANLSVEVSADETYVIEAEGEERHTVVAYDLGIKQNTPRRFSARGVRTVIVPAETPFEDIKQYNPSGVFISNGPGDPAAADVMVDIVREVLEADIPFFGICFGNQILGRAFGMETYKLKFGHRGINVPVKNHITGKIDITAQNHGFALKGEAGQEFETDFGTAIVTHTCLNDGVVEGIALKSGRAYSVQYHPEAAAGPNDASPLFDQFVELMDADAQKKGA